MFTGKKVLVLGLAKSGKAAVALLEHFHADITINESKKKEDIEDYEDYVKKGIEVVCGGQPSELFERDFDFVIKNPGINYHAPFIMRLKERGIPVYTEIELGYQVAKKQNYIAVTGTNGKTTTVSLIYEILKHAQHKVHICGNYGIPYCEVVLKERLYEESDHDVVIEMSNFQLIDIATFHPQCASVLNLTPDHLDYMDSLDEYYASKMRIYMNQREADLFVINADDPVLQDYLAKYPCAAQKQTFSLKEQADCMFSNQAIWYEGVKVIEQKDIKIVGLHNIANMMAAIMMCARSGVALDVIGEALRNFKGVEHRIEYVDEIKGVRYYNDSKGTNTDAAIIALKAFDQPVILLMGGHEKNLDLEEMSHYGDHIKTLICFGDAKERFAKDMHHDHTIIADHLKDALLKAYEIAEKGDIVLLSPSTSSFDEFKGYEERGRYFKELVKQLD